MAKRKTDCKRQIDDLRPDPRQSELFKDLNDFELAQLADDIRREGLSQPIQISAAGKIISGRVRMRIARKLGLKNIDFIVCDD